MLINIDYVVVNKNVESFQFQFVGLLKKPKTIVDVLCAFVITDEFVNIS